MGNRRVSGVFSAIARVGDGRGMIPCLGLSSAYIDFLLKHSNCTLGLATYCLILFMRRAFCSVTALNNSSLLVRRGAPRRRTGFGREEARQDEYYLQS